MKEKVNFHAYEYDVDLNGDSAAARLIRMVPQGCRVLEIGAGPGSITRHLSGTLGCDVVALDNDPTALEKLRLFAQSVYAIDLNNSEWSEKVRTESGLFDVIVAADVLEHVYNPWLVLENMVSLLNSSGAILLSLPHVGHAAIAGCLIDEDFEYRQWGLLDRTHIRFFGIKNIQELHSSQGLAIEQAEFVVRTPEMTEFTRRWRRLPKNIRSALQLNRFSHVYQVVTRAVPKERATKSLRLMDLKVFPPDPLTIMHWQQVMENIPLEKSVDLSPTFDASQIHSSLQRLHNHFLSLFFR